MPEPTRTDPGATLPVTAEHVPAVGPPAVPGFRIDGELGRGGMGVVYRATQTKLNRPVALKMVLSGEHADRRELARFVAEAEAVAAVAHPHVVQVFECGDHAGRPYFAMEHLPGGSLAAKLTDGPLPPLTAAALVRKIALGVQAAHELGIVHRDLKPANVLFDSSGEPKVTDFGLAKRGNADLTGTAAVMGTPAYMAPEQAAGRAKFVGPAADVYALGVILFECLSGRRPFVDPDPVSLLRKVVDDDPPRVREFAPAVPKGLEAVCQKCLSKEPQDRYATAGELADDLQRVLDGDSPTAAKASTLGGVWSALGRGRHAVEFAGYAGIFLWMAGVMAVVELIVYLAVQRFIPPWISVFMQYMRIVAFGVVVAVYRRGRLAPRTPPERMLWSLWGGYVLACLGAGGVMRIKYGFGLVEENQVYPVWGLLTALAFFSLGAGFWGWFYAFGILFLVAALAMAATIPTAPLIFGGLWAAVLLVFARHLQKLAREAGRVL